MTLPIESEGSWSMALFDRVFAPILGVGEHSLAQEGVRLGWAQELPGWLWVLICGAAVTIGVVAYARLSGSRPVRTALAGLRASTVVLLALVLAGPRLELARERVEGDWIPILVDRSASLTIEDAPDPTGRVTREQQLSDALAEHSSVFDELGERSELLWIGFGSGAFELSRADETAVPVLGQPDAPRTRLGGAIDEALRRTAARPVAGVVVISDGRSADVIPRAAQRRLRAEGIPVFAVPLGSPDAIRDAAVVRADAPRLAFLRDQVPVRAEVSSTEPGETVRVELVDTATGVVLDDTEAVTDEAGSADVVLRADPANTGAQRWAVRIVGDGEDLVSGNDERTLDIELVDRPMRVVYFDGYPRWEYRYLKNLLVREPSITSSASMIATGRRYLREGDEPLDALPRSPEEWAEFDAIVMGDVRPEVFSTDQLEDLRSLVAERGAGLVWIAGPGGTPGAWRGTPLADLLPFRAQQRPGESWTLPAVVTPTDAARDLALLRLDESSPGAWPPVLSDASAGWTGLRWVHRVDPASLKPGVQVLATAGPPGEPAEPSVMLMRYGAGRVIYVSTDEIWRWRYGRGELLHDRFWIPLIRHAGASKLAGAGRPAQLEARPARTALGTPVAVSLELFDQSLIDAAPSRIPVMIRPIGEGSDTAGTGVRLELEAADGGRGTRFIASWFPPAPGRYRIEPGIPLLAGLGLGAPVEVVRPDDELRRPETDHPALAELAERTGGSVVPVADLGSLSDLIPDRDVVSASAPELVTLWDRPAVFVVLLVLLTAEWIGRRILRLV
ncbi:MAG: hypothetical protein AAGG07_10130 [Planctomycetota bacterium]